MPNPLRNTRIGNERGATIVVVAASLAVIIGMAALAIDLGMLLSARAEAQRAADAAALAGASAFIDGTVAPSNYKAEATTRATRWNTDHDNRMLRNRIAMDEVKVLFAEGSPTYKVEVEVGRSFPTFFARIFGVTTAPVSARATAAAVPGSSVTGVRPFAIADLWYEADTKNQDKNGNKVWDYEETWKYEPLSGDRYVRTGDGANATGYGSTFRDGNADFGRMVKLKLNNPGQNTYPSIFQAWAVPGADGESKTGGNNYGDAIKNGSEYPVVLNKDYKIEPGNMLGPTLDGIAQLLCEDAGANWDTNTQKITGSKKADPNDTPRLITLALYDPKWIDGSGRQTIQFNNFAKFFLEMPDEWKGKLDCTKKNIKAPSNADVIQGRFLYFVGGGTAGNSSGSLIKAIRLIK
jgi:hypothetical protein